MQVVVPDGYDPESIMIWCHYQQKFVGDVKYSLINNTYLNNDRSKIYYREVYFPYELQPNQLGFVKFNKNNSTEIQ